MKWWTQSLDLASTAKYNLAARWLLRQHGALRQRGEEFDPDELAYVPAVTATDPDTGESIELSPPDYLAGLNKLLEALEKTLGLTSLGKKGELRQHFYVELRRKPGERLMEFCTRFRTLVSDLKTEGVHLPDGELGWFLREKLGLDPLRRQLLDTALQGREAYADIETESLRLFKDLHLSDPLNRRFDGGGRFDNNRSKLTIRRMFGAGSLGSSAASTAPSRASSLASSTPMRRPSSLSVSSGSTRRAYVTEADPDPEPAADEVMETVAEVEEEDAGGVGLEDYLQSEAEVFAAELQAAEEQGIDSQTLEEMESNFEKAAETLVTMKEARLKLNEIRKDRGFGKPSTTISKANAPASKKQSGKHPCFDCGQTGHWAGDKECPSPGAGLARRNQPASGKVKPPGRQVRVVETYAADHVGNEVAVGSPSSSTSFGSPTIATTTHEASVVYHDGYAAMPLDEALRVTNTNPREHSTLASAVSPEVLPEDKQLAGALDSACNRTCAGPKWLEGYLREVYRIAPDWVLQMIDSVEEQENFRFGNGGLVTSSKRWRLPCMVSGKLLLIWISIVPVVSLGCLLGRDFLDAVGGVLNFAAKTLQRTFLGTGSQRLTQMSAGHFRLPMDKAKPWAVETMWSRWYH